MSDRTRRHSRVLSPMAEGLETRQLLATHIAGVDIDGDRWVLDLIGPGDFNVTRRPATADGDPVPLDEPGLINAISIAGTAPKSSRLVGQVFQGPNGDGKVFFNSMTQFGGNTQIQGGTAGLLAIDIPDFWLASTGDDDAGDPEAGLISIPDGVVTLRFGGVDVTQFFGTSTSTAINANGQADSFSVQLGLPFFAGTSVILNSVITDAQTGTTDPFQDSVTFLVQGRLNLFEANTIRGNTALPPDPFATTGGTVVRVTTGNGGVTPAIDEIRINGDATNFSTQLQDQGLGTERLKTFFVGGEANNVSLVAPAGSRIIKFGRGLDTVNINSHVIESLEANRSAINSDVVVERTIGRVRIGGDAINSRFLSGYVASPGGTPQAQIGGGMTVLVGGSVTNSIFAASVEPQDSLGTNYDTGWGGKNDIVLTAGTVDAKIEGKIDNSGIAETPQKAVFADGIRLERGPTVPPTVPEPPYGHPFPRPRALGVPKVVGSKVRPQAKRDALAAAQRIQAQTVKAKVPGGPLAAQKAKN